MMHARFWALSLLLVPTLALSAGPHVESSLLVAGTITVNPDGSVRGYTLYKQDKLQPFVVQIVKKTIAAWRFQPIVDDGKPVAAKTGMMLRIVADKLDDKHMSVKVGSEQFGCNAWLSQRLKLLPDVCASAANLVPEDRQPPRYPLEALRDMVGGNVFLTLRIGRDGRVAQAAVRQVNLYSLTRRQDHFRSVLGDAALGAARRWRFKIPTVGSDAAKDYWVVTIPVRFTIDGDTAHRNTYGSWNAYVPGPTQEIPWAARKQRNTDAIAGDGAFLRDPRLVLKTAPATGAGKS